MAGTSFHRTQTLELKGGTYASVCSCGWVSTDFPERDNCVKAANLHKVQGMRENTKISAAPKGA